MNVEFREFAYFPGLQASHATACELNTEARPFGHASHRTDADEFANVPAGHAVHQVAPSAAAAVPGTHA